MSNELMVCTPKFLPRDKWESAARAASQINPLNHAPIERLRMVMPDFAPTPERLAVLTTKYWGNAGVQLTVGFRDNPPLDLRAKILSHMNAWSAAANVKFVERFLRLVRIFQNLKPPKDMNQHFSSMLK